MKAHFDILVIGSGLAGLVSALILAKEGLKVCVLEKNNQFGGNLQTFSRDKLIFDSGVHYLGGLSEGQNLNRYFKWLEIFDELKLSKLDDDGFDRITFDGDDAEYPHSQGGENFVRQLGQFFPEEKENLQKYIETIRNVCDHFPRYLTGNKSYNEEILYENAKDFIESVTENSKLRSVLAGSNFLYAGTSETPLYVHALTVNSYIQSAYRCLNGGSQISKALIRKLRKYGAEIHKHNEVTEFYFDENNVLKSVKTKDKKEYFADRFISNIDLKRTIDLAGKQRFKKSLTSRVDTLITTTSCFSIYLVLKPETVDYFNHNYYHYRNEKSVWESAKNSKENWPRNYMLSCSPSKKHPGFAESITAISYMDFDEVKAWEHTKNTAADKEFRGEDYEDFKREKAENLISEIEKKFPKIRSAIEKIYTSTPLSYRDYIGNTNGNMYGFVKESNNPLKSMFSPRTKIPNLFLTGQSVNLHGILGVTIGAFNTCSELLGKDVFEDHV
ncbi:NAD(P)/FAD-dependent oxidoreductase [Chryseobacterium suipulveris]|uniref:NAD(P)/FAD-dependent oxidoreductase n=1 Tax=Chryseobacterium suipulveris TaxID=2929800 RepID=A0ABY4BNU0_9FLAO|nr:NAD(P)/FAD-dependent oxidoreductase [Chryseobacterium suipulveris]UOE40842.1 NAD(P)/FAD-dependent oxidoreductase [Chryseobacterium suipulveris]